MREKTYDIVLIGVFSAIIAVISLISVPIPIGVPLTLQTFIVSLTGYFLGSKKASISVLIYILMGAIGLPVFSSFRGGLGALFDLTGGFIFGFIPLAIFCGIKTSKTLTSILYGVVGLMICHITGIVWFGVYSDNFSGAFLLASLPYIPKDIICVISAFFISKKLKSVINKQKN